MKMNIDVEINLHIQINRRYKEQVLKEKMEIRSVIDNLYGLLKFTWIEMEEIN